MVCVNGEIGTGYKDTRSGELPIDISEGNYGIIDACTNNQYIKDYILFSKEINVCIRLILKH